MLTANPTIQPLAANDAGLERSERVANPPAPPFLFYAIVSGGGSSSSLQSAHKPRLLKASSARPRPSVRPPFSRSVLPFLLRRRRRPFPFLFFWAALSLSLPPRFVV